MRNVVQHEPFARFSRAFLLACLAAGVAAAGAACGGGAMPQVSQPAAEAPAGAMAMDDAASAERALGEAEQTLAALFGERGVSSADSAPAEAAGAPEPSAPDPDAPGKAEPRPSAVQAPAEPSGSAEKLSGGGCADACRALGSMSRAQGRLCELTGDEDPRCADARSRVERASGRVKAACPDCSG